MPAFVLVRRLCTALRSWNFVDRFGPSALERVVNERAGNCIDLSAVLCAALRARHLERCYVLLGSKRDLFPAAMHAWVLAGVERPHAWVLVDPDRFEPEPRCPRTIEERLTLLAIFNDRELITGAASRADFLAAACMEGSRE